MKLWDQNRFGIDSIWKTNTPAHFTNVDFQSYNSIIKIAILIHVRDEDGKLGESFDIFKARHQRRYYLWKVKINV